MKIFKKSMGTCEVKRIPNRKIRNNFKFFAGYAILRVYPLSEKASIFPTASRTAESWKSVTRTGKPSRASYFPTPREKWNSIGLPERGIRRKISRSNRYSPIISLGDFPPSSRWGNTFQQSWKIATASCDNSIPRATMSE